MSRVRNANEFLLGFRKIRKAYEDIFAPRVAQLRSKYAGKPEEGFLDKSLEAHVRMYVVNALLTALNWRLDQKPGRWPAEPRS